MADLKLPTSLKGLWKELTDLRASRRSRQKANLRARRRRALTPSARKEIFQKTSGRCHICGGSIEGPWQADHVLSHNAGGEHSVDNFLPAHALCNNYRWDYSAEEFQWILKIGIWARHKMESESKLGGEMLERFFNNEIKRERRRKGKIG